MNRKYERKLSTYLRVCDIKLESIFSQKITENYLFLSDVKDGSSPHIKHNIDCDVNFCLKY